MDENRLEKRQRRLVDCVTPEDGGVGENEEPDASAIVQTGEI
jgi:hypothetical protein